MVGPGQALHNPHTGVLAASVARLRKDNALVVYGDGTRTTLSRLREVGAPLPVWSSRDAIVEFVRWGWDRPGADSAVWDDALEELSARGLTAGGEEPS